MQSCHNRERQALQHAPDDFTGDKFTAQIMGLKHRVVKVYRVETRQIIVKTAIFSFRVHLLKVHYDVI